MQPENDGLETTFCEVNTSSRPGRKKVNQLHFIFQLLHIRVEVIETYLQCLISIFFKQTIEQVVVEKAPEAMDG